MPCSFPDGSDSKASVCNVRQSGFNPWVGKIPWRRKWQPPPVLLPGEFHGQRGLVSYRPWGHKESDTTEWLTHTHTHTHTHVAWGISVLWPQIESRPQQWKPGNPNHYATGELPQGDLFSELENWEGKPGLMSPETRVSMRLYKTILRARLSDTCNFSTTCLSRATE